MKKDKDLLSDEELKIWLEKTDIKIPQKGYWFEIIDFSESDYGSDWGFWGFKDGHHIYSSGDIASKIRRAGDYAREWKKRKMQKARS